MAATAEAADIEGPSHIDAVTVFPDQAQITRALKVKLDDGDQTLVIKDLPSNLDTASLRIEASGTAGIQIGSVDMRLVTPPPPVALLTSDGAQQIAALQAERATLDDTIEAVEGKRHLIDRLGTAATDGFLKGIGEGKTTAGQLKDTWTAFGDGLTDALAAIRAAHTRQHAIDDEIARIKAATTHMPNPERPHNEARVSVSAPGTGEATFRLTYRVVGASWQPVYDAKLIMDASGKPKVELVTRALVSQTTGEDWDGADLTLSTARPALGTAAPDLKPTVVRLWQQPANAATMPMPSAPMAPTKSAVPRPKTSRFSGGSQLDAEEAPEPAEEITAQVESNGTTTVFHIPGHVTIDSGQSARNLKISVATIEAQLSAKATPKQLAAAFLTAQFKPQGEAALLPGRVSIYRGGEFVGSGQIPFTAPGDDVKLGFGEDDKLKVDRVALRQSEGDTGIFGSTHQETHDFKIRIKNLHVDVMPITIEDQIPVSEASEIVVEKLSTTTPPSKTNADDRRGVLTWSFDLKPNEEKEIRIGWRLKYPADRPINTVTLDH
jgi:uncharacterized protein (TIGR02231 family)